MNEQHTIITFRDEAGYTSSFKKGELRGEGNHSFAYTARNISNEKEYLIKEFKYQGFGSHGAKSLHQTIGKVGEAYRKKGGNYLLETVAYGEVSYPDGRSAPCHIFSLCAGATLEDMRTTYDLSMVLHEFSDLLRGLKIFHENGWLHLDIKPGNLYRFYMNQGKGAEAHLQLLDFGSLETINDFYGRFCSIHRNDHILSSTPEYYDATDVFQLEEILEDESTEAFCRAAYALDLTAAARVFAVMLCQGERFPSSDKLNQTISEINHEGIRTALSQFFAKAFAPSLQERFFDVEDMQSAVLDIIGALPHSYDTVTACKIAAYESESYASMCRMYRSRHGLSKEASVTLQNLLEEIDLHILADIRADKEFRYEGGETPLARLLLEKDEEILLLRAEGGSGKTTALKTLYLQSLQDTSKQAVLYLSLKSLPSNEPISADLLKRELGGGHLDDLSLDAKVTVLLDSYDEIEYRRRLPEGKEEYGQDKSKTSDTYNRNSYDEDFFKAIEEIRFGDAQLRWVVAGRVLPKQAQKRDFEEKYSLKEEMNKTRDVKVLTVEALPLRPVQINNYLTSCGQMASEPFEQETLLELLSNPMMLGAFASVNDERRYHVDDEGQLLELFFEKLYEAKLGTLYKFEERMNAIALASLGEQELAIEDEAVGDVFKGFFDNKKMDDGTQTLEFSHEIYKEYFMARGLYLHFCECFAKDAEGSDYRFFMNEYSYQTLRLLGKKLLFSEDEEENRRNRQCLEEFWQWEVVCRKDRKGKKHNVREYKRSAKAALENRILFDGNLIRVVLLAYEGDVRTFNFGASDDFWMGLDICYGLFANCNLLKRLILPEGFGRIDMHAFQNCSYLEQIILSKTIHAGDWGNPFAGCSSLKEIIVAEGNPFLHSSGNCLIDTKGRKLICGCKNSVIPGDGSVETIGFEAFEGCESLVKIELSEGLKRISSEAFSLCSSLSKIEIPDSVEWIGEGAFRGCSKLAEIKLPERLKNIGRATFANCFSLKRIKIPNSVEKIGDDTLTSIFLDSSVDGAFRMCTALESVDFPKSLKVIGTGTFDGCSSLSSIELSDNVEKICDGAFQRCTNLKNINLSKRLKTIETRAFAQCTSLEKIEFPDSVKEIGTDEYSIIGAPIGIGAFEDCVKLRNIRISKEINFIGVSTFNNCTSLSKVELLEGITYIDQTMRLGDILGLKILVLPKTIKYIGENVFWYPDTPLLVFQGTKNAFLKMVKKTSSISIWPIRVQCTDGELEL